MCVFFAFRFDSLLISQLIYCFIKGYQTSVLLSKITVGQGLAPAENALTSYGNIAKEQIELLCSNYNNINIDKYIIMPNHIHLIISIIENAAGASPCPTISDVICALKSKITLLCKRNGFNEMQIFQNSFHDHIIRGEKDYQKNMGIYRHQRFEMGKRLFLYRQK